MNQIIQTTIDRLVEVCNRPDCPTEICHELGLIALDLQNALNADALRGVATAAVDQEED